MSDRTLTVPPRPTRDPVPGAPNRPIVDVLPAHVLDVVPARPLPEPVLDVLPVRQHNFFIQAILWVWWLIGSVSEWVFGAFALVLGLSILSAIPVLQFLTLGYLLEVAGRIARTGRLRDGFIGVRRAARAGSIALGTLLMWLLLLPASSMTLSAQVVDPGGVQAIAWRVGLSALTIGMFVHIALACARGGKLRYFFWPFNFLWILWRIGQKGYAVAARERPWSFVTVLRLPVYLWHGVAGYYVEARDAVWDFVVALRLPYYFWLGFRGYVATMAWLVVPIFLISLGGRVPPIGIFGSALLMLVLLYVPLLQTRFARDNRFRMLFAWWTVRQDFRRAPVAFAFAFIVTLVFALPLYLFKIEKIPSETIFLESLIFIVFMFPTRLLTGWAYGRAMKRTTPRHWFFRWTSRLSVLPVVFFYVFLLYFTQYLSWDGLSSLYDQHAYLLPTPFWGWK